MSSVGHGYWNFTEKKTGVLFKFNIVPEKSDKETLQI